MEYLRRGDMPSFRPLLLMYHAVSDAWDDVLSVRVPDFERQLHTFVARGYRGATASEILARPHDRRLLHVTFDDAYTSVVNAFPVLEELGIPCTIFVCTDYASDGRPLAIPELSQRGTSDDLRTMDWNMLRDALTSPLVGVGSHGLTHADFTALDDDRLEAELKGSRRAIESELGRPCPLLAYPFGRHDARVRAAAERAGYDAAFAIGGLVSRFDRYRVTRLGVWRNESRARRRLREHLVVRRISERRDPGNSGSR